MKDIIKALNNYIKVEYSSEGNFIETQTYTVDRNFKTYRHYKVGLYYVLNGKTTAVIEDTITEKYTEETKELVEKSIKIKFTEMIFDFVASPEFKDLMYGRIDI